MSFQNLQSCRKYKDRFIFLTNLLSIPGIIWINEMIARSYNNYNAFMKAPAKGGFSKT